VVSLAFGSSFQIHWRLFTSLVAALVLICIHEVKLLPIVVLYVVEQLPVVGPPAVIVFVVAEPTKTEHRSRYEEKQ